MANEAEPDGDLDIDLGVDGPDDETEAAKGTDGAADDAAAPKEGTADEPMKEEADEEKEEEAEEDAEEDGEDDDGEDGDEEDADGEGQEDDEMADDAGEDEEADAGEDEGDQGDAHDDQADGHEDDAEADQDLITIEIPYADTLTLRAIKEMIGLKHNVDPTVLSLSQGSRHFAEDSDEKTLADLEMPKGSFVDVLTTADIVINPEDFDPNNKFSKSARALRRRARLWEIIPYIKRVVAQVEANGEVSHPQVLEGYITNLVSRLQFFLQTGEADHWKVLCSAFQPFWGFASNHKFGRPTVPALLGALRAAEEQLAVLKGGFNAEAEPSPSREREAFREVQARDTGGDYSDSSPKKSGNWGRGGKRGGGGGGGGGGAPAKPPPSRSGGVVLRAAGDRQRDPPPGGGGGGGGGVQLRSRDSAQAASKGKGKGQGQGRDSVQRQIVKRPTYRGGRQKPRRKG